MAVETKPLVNAEDFEDPQRVGTWHCNSVHIFAWNLKRYVFFLILWTWVGNSCTNIFRYTHTDIYIYIRVHIYIYLYYINIYYIYKYTYIYNICIIYIYGMNLHTWNYMNVLLYQKGSFETVSFPNRFSMETCSIQLMKANQNQLFWSWNQDTPRVPFVECAWNFRWRLLSPGPRHYYTISRLVTHATVRRFSQALFIKICDAVKTKEAGTHFPNFFLLCCTIAKNCL